MSMDVRWGGHATVLVAIDGARILTDPVLTSTFARPFVVRRAGCAPEVGDYSGVDAVLISHAHQDHLHLPSLRRLGEGVRLIVPVGTGRWLERRGFRNVEELPAGHRLAVGALEVRATPAAHHGSRFPFGPAAASAGYLVQGSSRLYFAGDTDLFPEMASLPAALDGPLDLALLPVGGWGPTLRGGHMDPVRATEALRRLRPRVAVPVHWGTFWPRGFGAVRAGRFHLPGPRFRDLAAVAAPEVEVQVLRPGERLAPAGSGMHL